MARLHRRYGKRRKRSSTSSVPRNNPPLMSDLVEWVAPGFAGFAATRFATRIAATQVEKLKPDMGKHAGAAVSVGSFFAAWFLSTKLKYFEKYQTPITVGAAIAAIQSLIQLYIPKIGWMIADATPDLVDAITTPDPTQLAVANLDLKPTDEDPNEYVYNDTYDAGRYGHANHGGHSDGAAAASNGAARKDDVSDLEIDDAIGQSQNLGVFTN